METSSTEVKEVQSRTDNASVAHRNGHNKSAAQTTAGAAVPGSIASFFSVVVVVVLTLTL